MNEASVSLKRFVHNKAFTIFARQSTQVFHGLPYFRWLREAIVDGSSHKMTSLIVRTLTDVSCHCVNSLHKVLGGGRGTLHEEHGEDSDESSDANCRTDGHENLRRLFQCPR
jgi:hypothetical protein